MTDKNPGFMKQLAAGQLDQGVLFPFPELPPDQRETVQMAIDAIDQLLGGRERDFAAWDKAGEIPPAFIEELRQFGLFGLILPEESGGMAMGNMAYARTLQAVARHDASVAITIGAHSSIGMRGLKLFGTPEQQARYYDKLASGEMIAAFCLTEPGAGSDAAAVRSTAEDRGDHYLLSGDKIWITNGGIADFFTVFAKTKGADQRSGLSAFIVTRDMAGVRVGSHEDKMGIRGSSTTTVSFHDVRVPKDHLLGPLNGGFKVAMNVLNSGRSGLGGGCVGGMKRLIQLSTAWATERQQFGRPIAEFGLVKQKLGHMVVDCYAAESAVTLVAALSDGRHDDYAVEAAIAKVFATEALWRSADEALQIAGGSGFMRELPYERILRDSRINRIFEGTNDILRLFIALTALNDVGQGLRELAENVKGIFDEPIKGFGLLRDYGRRHVEWRTGYGAPVLDKCALELRAEAEHFEELSRQLAAMGDRLLRKHGKQIVERQFAMRRMADVMIDLFVLAATLSRVTASIQRRGADVAAPEIEIAQVLGGQVRGRVTRNFRKIDSNDDEAIKALAERACAAGRFEWDALLG
jgi:alkylation response protein AidB-like acyl-CoA dehydrogenase